MKDTRRLITSALALTLLALVAMCAAPAQGYVPKRGVACHRGYVAKHRVVKHHGHRRRVRVCLKRSVAAGSPASSIKLHAHLSPTHTRDPRDPFHVTYSYGASATRADGGGGASASTASASAAEDAPLPSGVLSLFSDGVLYCAVNVGGQAVGDECPVEYAELGQHRVTSVYTSGEDSSTVTEVQTIEPLPTTTSLVAAFVVSAPRETDQGSEVYLVGELTAQTSGVLDGGATPGPVLARWEDGWQLSVGGGPFAPLPGTAALHATTHPPLGYAPSEASAQVAIDPRLPLRVVLDEVTVAPSDGPTAVASEVYDKATGADTPLELRARFLRLGLAAGCVVKLRTDGQSVPGDEGREASGAAVSEIRNVPDLGPGAVTVEAVVEATEGEDCQVRGLLYASE
jgi:hypothetical protein